MHAAVSGDQQGLQRRNRGCSAERGEIHNDLPMNGEEPLMYGEGQEDGVEWRIEEIDERVFKITVRGHLAELSEEYNTLYPTVWGLDVFDHAQIEAVLDRLLLKAKSSGMN